MAILLPHGEEPTWYKDYCNSLTEVAEGQFSKLRLNCLLAMVEVYGIAEIILENLIKQIHYDTLSDVIPLCPFNSRLGGM